MKRPSGAALGLLAGLAAGAAGGWYAARRPEPPPPPAVNPQLRALDADLWVQTAAEYRACCLQTYKLAAQRLRAKAAAAKEAPGDKPLAVVLDLDETVFDNSLFQSFLYEHRLKYEQDLWSVWEKDYADEVRLVPGAKEFIEAAADAGLTVVYISNRAQKYKAGTVQALKHLGLSTAGIDARLLLATDTSDKSARRERVEAKYQVLMYVGDNLRDFSEEFAVKRIQKGGAKTRAEVIAERYHRVDRHRDRWGDDWVILPNPVYGEWATVVGEDPAGALRPSKMKAPASKD